MICIILIFILNRAQNFVNTCNKAQAVMDDVLPGVIIEAVLGVEVTDIPQITDQLDFPPSDDNFWYLHQVGFFRSAVHSFLSPLLILVFRLLLHQK